jgi:hypothetical protein
VKLIFRTLTHFLFSELFFSSAKNRVFKSGACEIMQKEKDDEVLSQRGCRGSICSFSRQFACDDLIWQISELKKTRD